MIRHSSSFFISLVIHSILLILVVITYKTYYSKKEEVCETRICVELRELESQKELKKPIVKPKKIVKKQKKKPKEKKKKKKPTPTPKANLVPVIQKITEPKIIEEQIVETPSEVKKVQAVVIKPKEKSIQELKNEKNIKQENIIKEYEKVNTQEISRLIKENLYYPRSARKRGITGKVIVKFMLEKTANVSSVVVVKSNSDILTRAAIKTIESLSGKFPKPQENITLNIPISYNLK